MSLFDKVAPKKAGMPAVLRSAIAMVPKVDAFFGYYLASVKFVERKGFGSVMATDCASQIFYDPDMMRDGERFADPALLACVIVHELCHIWRMDGFFLEGRDPQLSNVALDAVINRDMLNSGYVWPGIEGDFSWRTPEEHLSGLNGPIRSTDPGETAIDVYARIEAAQKDKAGQRGQGDIDMDAFRKAVEAAGGAEAFKRSIGRKIAAAEAQAEAAAQGDGDGQGDGGKPDKPQAGSGGGDGTGAGHGTDGVLSGQLMKWHGLRSRRIENPLKNVVGSAVRATLTARSKRGRSIMLPHPLTDVLGYIRPGRKFIPDIRPAVAFDMSGSISRETLVRFGQEARHWSNGLKQRGHTTAACFFNHRIAESGNLNQYLSRNEVPEPCGGTSFKPIFDEWLPKIGYAPTHLLIWTDCMGSFPAKLPRGLKIVWIVPKEFDTPQWRAYEYFVEAAKLGKIVYSK